MDVIILGAGAAGLSCAYDLEQKGLQAVLVEAQDRVGGRCLTLRKGNRIVEEGQPEQTCAFENGRYFNSGPARIPQHHRTVRDCVRLGVPLEPFVNRNHGAFLHTDKGPWTGRRILLRDLDFDLRGRSFELLFRAIQSGDAGAHLDVETRKNLLAYLASYGALDSDAGTYTGTDRRTPSDTPNSLADLLSSGMAWKLGFFEEFDMQPSMLQIVGGTDRLTEAYAKALSSPIRLETIVREVVVSKDEVVVRVERHGEFAELRAPKCVVTLPLPALARVTTNLSSQFKEDVQSASYETAVKVGLECTERWWETELDLYGGMTFTDLPSTQAWYPSHGFGGKGGVLLGAYNFWDQGGEYSNMTPQARADVTAKNVGTVHGRIVSPRSAISVAWRNMPWARGAYANEDYSNSEALSCPHPRLRLAGEHMSHQHGWIAGALESGSDAAAWVSANG